MAKVNNPLFIALAQLRWRFQRKAVLVFNSECSLDQAQRNRRPNATIARFRDSISLHHDHERSAANASSSDITRISPGAIPSTRHGPTATRIKRRVGKPTFAVIRRT